jgi:N-acetylmuramoyl-L-alanine amidase
VRLATDSKSYKVSGSAVSQIRLGQFANDTARIVLDLNRKVSYKVLRNGPSREVILFLGNQGHAEGSGASKVTPIPDKIKPVNITDIKVEPDGDSKVNVRISTSGPPTAKAFLIGMPHRLVVDVQKGIFITPNERIVAEHPLLRGIRTGQQSDLARIVCDVTRMVIFETRIDASGITLKLGIPAKAGGKLSDKLIVIDAGHGGKDKGATCRGIMEKDLNFQIARCVKTALEDAGARVILTREQDCALDLAPRPKVADDYCADFFISLHCNSNTVPESASGIETYYHFDQLSSKTLASAIHDRAIQKTGMKDKGARSDGTLYDVGLAVLRNANVPAILLECGYINCTSDRSLLCDNSYRAKIAEAIVDGLRDYVEGKIDQEGNQ